MKGIPRFTVRQQSIVPYFVKGWRETRITHVKVKSFFTLEHAIEYAIRGYTDTDAESHYAVITGVYPPRVIRHPISGTGLDGFRKPTLPFVEQG